MDAKTQEAPTREVPHSQPYPPAFQAWTTVLILLLFYVTSLLDRNIVTLLGEQIRTDLGLTDVQLSLLYGPAFAVSYAAGALPLGWAMDRYSRRVVLWAGVTVWSAGTIACGLSRSFGQLFAARTLVGAGEAVMVPGNQSILADTFPPERLGLPMAVYTLGSKFGQGASLAIGGFLTAVIAPAAVFGMPFFGELWGWQIILIIVGAPGALIALLIFAIPEPARRVLSAQATAGTYRDFFVYMKDNLRFFAGILGGPTMASIVSSAIMAWTPAYFIRLHGLPLDQAGYWLGLAIVIGPVIGMPIHGMIADRLFRRGMFDGHIRYVIGTCLLSIPFLIAAYSTGNTVLAFILFSLGYTLFTSYAALTPVALQVKVPGEMRGKAASVSLVVTAVLGLSLGPTVTAWLSEGLFADPNQIGMALAICVAVVLPLTALAYRAALKPLRESFAGRF